MSYFPRGEGPLASIILPTRGRVKWFLECVDSMWSLAKDQHRLELVVKADWDDKETIQTALNLSTKIPVRLMITPRGKGYMELHQMVNELSALARGDWLFIWNDDARMLTQDWDEVLAEADPSKVPGWKGSQDVCLFAPTVVEREASWEFPILRRKVFQILGRFSMTYSNDSWIYWVMNGIHAGCIMADMKVTHFQNEIEDTIKTEGRLHAEKFQHMLDTDQTKAWRATDQLILKAHLMGHSNRGY